MNVENYEVTNTDGKLSGTVSEVVVAYDDIC
jgi:sporulation protein YlmC with PRC-barrel domain